MFPSLNVSLAIKQLDEVIVTVVGHLKLILAELEIQLLAHLGPDQSKVLQDINQLEHSVTGYQPIRTQCYRISTNQKTVLQDINQPEYSAVLQDINQSEHSATGYQPNRIQCYRISTNRRTLLQYINQPEYSVRDQSEHSLREDIN